MQEISANKPVKSGKTGNDSGENRALAKVKDGLYSVKVSRHDATQVQREIEGELFDKWHEGCEVMSKLLFSYQGKPLHLNIVAFAFVKVGV